MRIELIAVLIMAFWSCDSSKKWETQYETQDMPKPTTYEGQVNRYRDSISAVFFSGSNQVLPKADISPEGRLHYFPPNEAYRVKAEFEPITAVEIFRRKTNTDRLPEYKKYGILHFRLANQDLQLFLYQNVEQPDYLFCPFKDLSNGDQSYGSGRFLDFKADDLTNVADVVLDFNYAYNPYCAYNKNYSCPLPPVENHLDIAIYAGEKKWH